MTVTLLQTLVVSTPVEETKEYAQVPPTVVPGSLVGVVINAVVEVAKVESMLVVALSQPPDTRAPPITAVVIVLEADSSRKSPLTSSLESGVAVLIPALPAPVTTNNEVLVLVPAFIR